MLWPGFLDFDLMYLFLTEKSYTKQFFKQNTFYHGRNGAGWSGMIIFPTPLPHIIRLLLQFVLFLLLLISSFTWDIFYFFGILCLISFVHLRYVTYRPTKCIVLQTAISWKFIIPFSFYSVNHLYLSLYTFNNIFF